MTSPVNGYAGTNVYLQKIVADALTNAIPDLVLVLIGVNDIGRGRDPYQVATNDMPNLLDIIFSNAPNASVILAKITTLSLDASGLDYYAYYTNVSIYNAALQAMVNQRRALGQNVSLADMFSAVGISSTMFNADGLHPNAPGLQAIAQEWFTRIQAVTITTNQVTSTLIHGGDAWKYSDTGQDLGTNWSQPNYDDSGWASGPARLGYGDPAVLTTVSFGPDPTNRYHHNLFPRLVCRARQRNPHQSQFPPLASGWRRGMAQRSGGFPHQHASRTNRLHEPGHKIHGERVRLRLLPDKPGGIEFASGNEPGRGGSPYICTHQNLEWPRPRAAGHGLLFARSLHSVRGRQHFSCLAGCQRNRLHPLLLNQPVRARRLDKCGGNDSDQRRAVCRDLVARRDHEFFPPPEALLEAV
jgi:hypothetical protein